MAQDHYGYGPQMMWGDPGRLRAICEHWLRTSPPSGAPTDATNWCDSMVSWITTHIGNWSGRGTWGDWMRYGPMAAFGDPTTTSPPASSPAPSGNGHGDTDHDGDCGPGIGDGDHDGDGGPGYGPVPGYGPGSMMGY